jgi:ring-1,2-phenylacetyl-CoA epoxidase subunit PaaC
MSTPERPTAAQAAPAAETAPDHEQPAPEASAAATPTTADEAAPPAVAVFEGAVDREATEHARRAAAPVTAAVEAIGALDADTRRALYTLLVSLADNKYMLGRRYAEWCTGAPLLESAVAAAAMAQDELGHARSFYPLLRGFPDASDAVAMEEEGWQSRPTSPMACLDRPFQTWADFVAANLVVDTALTTLLEAAMDSPYEPLRQRARKIVQEEEAHWMHVEGWVPRLAADPEAHASLVASLQRMWEDAFTWFGLPDDPVVGQLTGAGLLAWPPDELRDQLRNRLCPLLEAAGLADEFDACSGVEVAGLGGLGEQAGLTAELINRSLPWERWDPERRRLRTRP